MRVVEIEGNPWFAAADVCKALDLGKPRAIASDRPIGRHRFECDGEGRRVHLEDDHRPGRGHADQAAPRGRPVQPQSADCQRRIPSIAARPDRGTGRRRRAASRRPSCPRPRAAPRAGAAGAAHSASRRPRARHRAEAPSLPPILESGPRPGAGLPRSPPSVPTTPHARPNASSSA